MCSTARGSGSRFSLQGPTKVKAHKSFLFTESSPKVENKEHICCQMFGFSKGCDENGDRVSKNDESCNICIS